MCALASPVFICKIPSDAIIALLEPLVPAFLNLSVRDVFAVPGRISDKFSVGCNNLIKTNRASVITSVKDLAYILNWEKELKNDQKIIQKQLFIELNEYEKTIYNYLLKEGKLQLDVISLHCNFPIYKTASILLNLELKGITRPLPGKYFEAV